MRDYVFVALVALVSGARRCALAPPAILVVGSLIHVVGPEAVLGTWVDGVSTLTNGAKGRRFVDDGSCIIDDD